MKVVVLLALCFCQAAGVIDPDLNWRSFIQTLVTTFGTQAYPDRTQFAVVILLSQQLSNTQDNAVRCSNIQLYHLCAHEYPSLTDAEVPRFPKDAFVCNYQAARPLQTSHAERQLMTILQNLWNNYRTYMVSSGHDRPQTLLLYTWIAPCQSCTQLIAQTLSQFPYSQVQKLLVYSTEGRRAVNTIMGHIRENIQILRDADIEVFQVQCDHPNEDNRDHRIEKGEAKTTGCPNWKSLQKCIVDDALDFIRTCVFANNEWAVYAEFINALVAENLRPDLSRFQSNSKNWMENNLGNGFACVKRRDMISQMDKAIERCLKADNTFIGEPLSPESQSDSKPAAFNKLTGISHSTASCSHGRKGFLCSNLDLNYFTVGNTYGTCGYDKGTTYRWAGIYGLSESYDYCCETSCNNNKCHTGTKEMDCSENGAYTKNNKRCALQHPCGKHSKGYLWCYTNTVTEDWDYC